MEKAKECQETVKCVSIALCFILQGCCFHTPQSTKLCLWGPLSSAKDFNSPASALLRLFLLNTFFSGI